MCVVGYILSFDQKVDSIVIAYVDVNRVGVSILNEHIDFAFGE